MPLAKYNKAFGGKKNAAEDAHAAMVDQYGKKKGEQVFYAKKNRNVAAGGPTGPKLPSSKRRR